MNNSGHKYVKAARTTTGPVRVIVAVPSPRTGHKTSNPAVRFLTGDRVWASYHKRTGTSWAARGAIDAATPDEFWRWVTDHCYPKCRTWIVAPSAGDLLTLTGWWDRVDCGEWQVFRRGGTESGELGDDGKPVTPWVGRLVLRGAPDIVTARRGDASVCAVSWANYSGAGLSELAGWVGLKDVAPDPQLCPRGLTKYTPSDTRRILAAGFTRLVSEWVERDCGPWRETSAQLVLSLWRRKFYKVKVCRHCDQDAAGIEREANHGGRASVWFFGDVGSVKDSPREPWAPPPARRGRRIGGPLTRLDVTSQYPTLLRDRYFPTRLVGVRDDLGVAELEAWARYRGVIARVTVRARHPEYPYRMRRRVFFRWPGEKAARRKDRLDAPIRTVYPVGEFTTTLAGPELLRLIEEDSVAVVHRAALYDVGKPFGPLMEYLLALRAEGKGGAEGVMVQLAKQWGVGFYGKFAQRSGTWEARPDRIPLERWGEYTDRNEVTRTAERWRGFAGLAQQWVAGQAGAKLLAAVYCYTTSYGRVQMRDLRAKCEPRSVLSMDTDGLWIAGTMPAALRIASPTGPADPGSLRKEGEYHFGRWYTPRHYYCDGSWVLSGVGGGFVMPDRLTVQYHTCSNPVRWSPAEPPRVLYEHTHQTDLRLVGPTEFIGRDGWAVPSRVLGDTLHPDDPLALGADAVLF